MNRRNFFKKAAALSPGLLLFPKTSRASSLLSLPQQNKSDVIIAKGRIISPGVNQLAEMLDNSMMRLFNRDNAIEAWRRVVRPGETVGIKVNCLSGRGSTHTELVEVVAGRLREAGIKPADIIIWDRFNRDLEDGGFQLNEKNNKIRCFGNDSAGFEYNLEMFGSAASRISKIITQQCDAIINLPLLRDHSIAGVTISLKNMFGAIHNPNKYHLNVGDPYIADINAFPALRNKIRLHICDAIEAQYEGGPSFMPQWRWKFNSLLVSTDPVALDFTGWQIIEKKRKEMGMKSLKEAGREPTYISTAADAGHRLGTNDPEKIKVVHV